ncbi:sensor histidine kinase [Flexithrix dorotheae]|uniref:sensor histidine kinase n=1 Tax=Flexithrix dorotheae TaxID=70993 RepID=UPI00146B6D33|nr:sensor histidine kinase [Flexithrix dorotheae]
MNSFSQTRKPIADNGILNLQKWNFEKDGAIKLDGEWLFYWNKFLDSTVESNSNNQLHPLIIKVPSAWNNVSQNGFELPGMGYATYRLKVLLPDSTERMGLKIPTVGSALDVFINGEKIAVSGTVGSNKAKMIPSLASYVTYFDLKGANEADIILHISNFYHSKGGIRNSFKLGLEKDIQGGWENVLFLELFLIGCIFIIGLYHQGLFILRKNDKSLYFFGLFCFLMALRITTTGEYLINSIFLINWEWVVKLEYLSFYFCVPAFAAYAYYVFPLDISRIIIRISMGVALGFSCVVIFTPAEFFSQLLVWYQIFSIGMGIYGIVVLYIAINKKREGANIFFIGFNLLFLSLVNDILYSNGVIQTGNYFSLGIFVFIFCQSFLLSLRFSNAFNRAESLTRALNDVNVNLENLVDERTRSLKKANTELTEKNAQINAQHEEMIKLSHELDKFVYSTSHDLRAPIASALGLVNLAKNEKNIHLVHQYLEMNEKCLGKLDGIIRDIINYSQNSRLEVLNEKIDFEKLTENVLENFLLEGDLSKIKINVNISGNQDFYSDESRLFVMLKSLISNSIRFSDLSKENPYIAINIKAGNDNAAINITDNGRGIEESHQEKIFDMFFKANENNSGSGLGLYIVNETLLRLGGKKVVSSKPGMGTTITLLIPNFNSGTIPVHKFSSTSSSI